jgi:hypothetical protein
MKVNKARREMPREHAGDWLHEAAIQGGGVDRREGAVLGHPNFLGFRSSEPAEIGPNRSASLPQHPCSAECARGEEKVRRNHPVPEIESGLPRRAGREFVQREPIRKGESHQRPGGFTTTPEVTVPGDLRGVVSDLEWSCYRSGLHVKNTSASVSWDRPSPFVACLSPRKAGDKCRSPAPHPGLFHRTTCPATYAQMYIWELFLNCGV